MSTGKLRFRGLSFSADLLPILLVVSMAVCVSADDDVHRTVTLTKTDAPASFAFETEQLSGTIRLDGPYHGVTSLTDKKTGLQVVDPRYSLLNLFRIFSTNLGLGTPRETNGDVRVSENAVEVIWKANPSHRAEIVARYQVREPNIVDLTITVRALAVYQGYDILLPSYFQTSMKPHVYLKRRKEGDDRDWVLPMFNEAYRGGVLAFPRDEHAARRYVDGRWSRGEYGMSHVAFYPLRKYAAPLGVMTDHDQRLGVVLMAPTRECSGVSCRYYAEDQRYRSTSYSAIDLTLLGDDLIAGDSRTAHVRLAVVHLNGSLDPALAAYREFIKGKQ